MDGMGAADCVRSSLGQAEVADLAGLNELGHRPDGVLDRGLGVDPVLVVQVDGVDTEPLQARVTRLADVVGGAADAQELAVLAAHVGELRRDDRGLAAMGDGLADQLLVGERAVHVGRVEQRDAQLERAVDGADRLRVVGGAVELAHPHAAQALGGDGKAVVGVGPQRRGSHERDVPNRAAAQT